MCVGCIAQHSTVALALDSLIRLTVDCGKECEVRVQQQRHCVSELKVMCRGEFQSYECLFTSVSVTPAYLEPVDPNRPFA
jgi:hypothetical protein